MSEINLNEKNITALTHALGGIFCFVPALIVYFAFTDMKPQYKEQVRRALNFQIFMTILMLIISLITPILTILSFGLLFFLPFVVQIVNIIFAIIAALEVNKDNLEYSYPISVAFVKPKNYIE